MHSLAGRRKDLEVWMRWGNKGGIRAEICLKKASHAVLVVKEPNLPASAGDVRDMGSIPGSARSPGGGPVYPLQQSCLGNPMDRGAWQATALEIPWTEEPGRLPSMGLQRVGHDWAANTNTHTRFKKGHSSFRFVKKWVLRARMGVKRLIRKPWAIILYSLMEIVH